MSSSSTDTTFGGTSDSLRALHTNNEDKLLLCPKITFGPGQGNSSSGGRLHLFREDGNVHGFIRAPSAPFREAKLIYPQRPNLEDNISKIHSNDIALSPLTEYIRPSNNDRANVITPNMTIRDRERRAALLADSPELPSKPPLESKMPRMFRGSYGPRQSSNEFQIHSKPISTHINTLNNSSSAEGDDDSSSAGFSTSRQSRRSSSSQSGSSSSSRCCCCSRGCIRLFETRGRNDAAPSEYSVQQNTKCSRLSHSSVWKGLLLGQLLSLLLCTMAVLCQLLVDTYGAKIPTGQSLLTYVVLIIIYFPLFWCHLRQKSQQQRVSTSKLLSDAFRERGMRYFIFAVIDVEGNYLLHKAFQYTTFTSIQLLDCFSIPMILVLSWTFLRCRYRLTHIGGMALGLMSVVVLVWVDIDDGKGGISSGGSKRMVGDILTLCSALLFGVSHVGLQHSVYFYNTYEFLGCVGLFGTIITVVQMFALERSELTSGIRWGAWETGILLAAFTAAQLTYYSCLPYMLKFSTAAELHLSHLASDFYSILAGLLLFQTNFQNSHILAPVLVVCGLVMFKYHKVPVLSDKRKRSALSGLHQYQHSEHVRSKMNGVNHKQNLTERDNFIDKRSASTSLLPSTIDMMTNSNGMPNKKSPSQRSVQSLRSVSQYSNHNHLRNHTDPSSSVSLLDRSLAPSNGNTVIFSME